MLNRISNRQLRAYRALVETGSVTRAAEALNLSQPTISRQISMLEDALGFKLFERLGNNRLVPSSLGERFYHEIEGTLRGIEDIPWIARGIQSSDQTRIRIFATAPIINADFFIDAIDRFRQSAPDVQLRLQWSSRRQIEPAVAGRQAEIGLAAGPIDHPALEASPILDGEAVLAVPRDHALAKQTSATLEDLKDEEIVLDQGRPIIPHQIGPGNEWSLAEPGHIDVQMSATALRLVATGNRVAICEPLSYEAFRQDVAFIPFRPKIAIPYVCFNSRGITLPKEQRALIAMLAICAEEWKDRHPHLFSQA